MADHAGVAPYRPNSLDGGCPFTAGDDVGALIDVPTQVPAGRKVRESPASFDDHFSQVRLFWRSLSPVEQQHTISAYTFELGKCYEQAVKERELQCLANVDPELCAGVAAGLGLPVPAPSAPLAEVTPSPALSQLGRSWPVDGRIVGIVADSSSDLAGVRAVRAAVHAAGMVPLVIAPHGGELAGDDGDPVPVQRTFLTARSVEYDAVLLSCAPAGDDGPIDPRVAVLIRETFRHAKVIGGWGSAASALRAADCDPSAPGVILGDDPVRVCGDVEGLLAAHRVWERFPLDG